MVRSILVIVLLLLPLGTETYHIACIALDPTAKTVYLSDPLEKECGSDVAACRRDVADKWAAHLKKVRLAQSPGVTRECQMFNVGSTPDETPRSRVRKWRDEAAAQATAGAKTYTKVEMTLFELE